MECYSNNTFQYLAMWRPVNNGVSQQDNSTFSLNDKVIIDGLMSSTVYGVHLIIASVGNKDVVSDPLSVTIYTIGK